MDLKVKIDTIPKHIEKLTIKHVDQRRLRDNLCISVKRENARCTALLSTELLLKCELCTNIVEVFVVGG